MIKVCEECNVAFPTNDSRKRFCNRSCSATANNRKRGNLSLKDCLGLCSRKIQARGGQDYCSTGCRQIHKFSLWYDGEWAPTSLEFPAWLREMIISNGCALCGWAEISPFTGKSPVQVDHKNGCSTDHRFENIQVLCPNCHSLTHNYGALNKGYGQRNGRRS